jgi:hypothetical protein
MSGIARAIDLCRGFLGELVCRLVGSSGGGVDFGVQRFCGARIIQLAFEGLHVDLRGWFQTFSEREY